MEIAARLDLPNWETGRHAAEMEWKHNWHYALVHVTTTTAFMFCVIKRDVNRISISFQLHVAQTFPIQQIRS